MTCVHIRELYQLCQAHNMRISGAELIHIVCHECGIQEECPSAVMTQRDEAEARSAPPPAPPEKTVAPNGP